MLEAIEKLDKQLEQMRIDWRKASPIMKKYIENRAKMIKEKRAKLKESIDK